MGGYEVAAICVAAAIRLERQRYISGELANVATGTLKAHHDGHRSPGSGPRTGRQDRPGDCRRDR